MKRCIDSGLWVPDSKKSTTGLEPEVEEEVSSEEAASGVEVETNNAKDLESETENDTKDKKNGEAKTVTEDK